MTYIRTFEDFYPPKREDGVPFTTARIREGASSVFSMSTIIDSITLAPVDANPRNPSSRSFTTSLATIAEDGWYWIVWEDAVGAQFIADPFQAASPTLSPIEILVRSEMPMTWDALASSQRLGLATLRHRIENVKATLLPAVVADSDESTYTKTLLAYLSKKAALDLIPTGIEYWMRQMTSLSATGTNETKSMPDPIAALRELAKRLAAEVEQIAANPGVVPSLLVYGDGPAVSNDGDPVTADPYEFEPAFAPSTISPTTTDGS